VVGLNAAHESAGSALRSTSLRRVAAIAPKPEQVGVVSGSVCSSQRNSAASSVTCLDGEKFATGHGDLIANLFEP
jgi:hypothetical protein